MNLVILTRPGDGKRIYVNPNNICTFCKNGDRTIISFVGDENCYINVLESPEAIANLIELGESKTVDEMQIVRCKDCFYADYIDDAKALWCSEGGRGKTVAPDDFCSYGRAEEVTE